MRSLLAAALCGCVLVLPLVAAMSPARAQTGEAASRMEQALAAVAQDPALTSERFLALVQPVDDEILKKMRMALSSPDPRVRKTVVAAFPKAGDPQAPRFLARLLKDPDPAVREAALAALVETGKPAVEVLSSRLLESGADPGVRDAAAVALGRIGDPAAIPALVQSLRPTSPLFHDPAAYALFQMGRDAVRPLGTLEPARCSRSST